MTNPPPQTHTEVRVRNSPPRWAQAASTSKRNAQCVANPCALPTALLAISTPLRAKGTSQGLSTHPARAPKPNTDSRTLLRFLQLEASMHILHLRVQNATVSRGTCCTPSRHFLHPSSPPLPSMQIALLTFQVATYTIFTFVSSHDCIQRAFAHKPHVQLFATSPLVCSCEDRNGCDG